MPTDTLNHSTAELDQFAEQRGPDLAAAEEATRRRARHKIIVHTLPLADRIARRYRSAGQSIEDLVQVARIGLVKAVNRYDPQRGSLTGYAIAFIDGELKRFLRDYSWDAHVPRRVKEQALEIRRVQTVLSTELRRPPTAAEIADHCGFTQPEVAAARLGAAGFQSMSLSQPASPGGAEIGSFLGADDPGIDLVGDRMTAAELVRRLPDKDRQLLALRFEKGMTQQEIGSELGISQMHVSRRLARLLSWLRIGMLSDNAPAWPGAAASGPAVAVCATELRLVISIRGEIDRDDSEQLWRRLAAALTPQARFVTIDLHAVPLMHTTGAAALMRTSGLAHSRGMTLELTRTQPRVLRTLMNCGLESLLAST